VLVFEQIATDHFADTPQYGIGVRKLAPRTSSSVMAISIA